MSGLQRLVIMRGCMRIFLLLSLSWEVSWVASSKEASLFFAGLSVDACVFRFFSLNPPRQNTLSDWRCNFPLIWKTYSTYTRNERGFYSLILLDIWIPFFHSFWHGFNCRQLCENVKLQEDVISRGVKKGRLRDDGVYDNELILFFPFFPVFQDPWEIRAHRLKLNYFGETMCLRELSRDTACMRGRRC